jgi:hypothetical protein
MNLAYNVGLSRNRGEATQEFYNRLWSEIRSNGIVDIPPIIHDGQGGALLGKARVVDPGLVYGQVSEILHGRGVGAEGCIFEACGLLLDSASCEQALEAGGQVLDVLELCLERLTGCVAVFLHESGVSKNIADDFYSFARLKFYAGVESFAGQSLWPLNPTALKSPKVLESLRHAKSSIDQIQAGIRPAGHLYGNDVISGLFFISRRAQSVEAALYAFDEEAKVLNRPLDFKGLHNRESQIIFTAETLALVAIWNGGSASIAQSAAAVSSALRSAYWLWLEDDDRAMGVLRVALEALSRLRTWIRNPTKAEKLESKEDTTPRDWLDAAGWRRLHALNLALGELAHTRTFPKWDGARELLVRLLPPNEDPELAPHRGRGFALDSLCMLGARTALEAVDHLSAEFSKHLRDLLEATGTFSHSFESALEEWLARNWDNRSFQLPESTFTGPAVELGARR